MRIFTGETGAIITFRRQLIIWAALTAALITVVVYCIAYSDGPAAQSIRAIWRPPESPPDGVQSHLDHVQAWRETQTVGLVQTLRAG